MRILIVGAGIGGLALAGFLEKEGIDYLIVDRENDWSKHGFSLGLWSNGRAILEKLGLADKFDESVMPYHDLLIKTPAGRTLKKYNLKYFYVNYGLAYSHVHRQDLHDWLLSVANARKIRMGTSVQSLIKRDKGMSVAFSNGEIVNFDLVVGADGVHSSIRNLYFSDEIERYINWRCWYVLPKRKLSKPHTVEEYLEPGHFCNVFDEHDNTLLILASYAEHSKFDDVVGRVNRLKAIFKSNPVVKEALVGLMDSDILPTDLAEVKVRRWWKDNVVLLGDAAHAFEPFAGLGGSMAMEDAYILAGEIMKISKDYTMAQALQTYERIRKPRVKAAFRVTRKMKLWATLRSTIMYRLMNIFAPLVPTRLFYKDFVRLMNKEM